MKVVGPVQAAAAHSERVFEAAVQALNHAIALGVAGSGGDVLDTNGLAQGLPDDAPELGASFGGSGCGDAKVDDPGGNESVSAVIRSGRGERDSFHPPVGPINYSKKMFITPCCW